MLRHSTLLAYLLPGCLLSSGCSFLPEIAHQPTFHNPFPQLSRVAVAPFYNHSDEPSLEGDRVAMAYYNELQLIPGFEVVPVNTTAQAIRENHLSLDRIEDVRRLAQILEVDVVVVGAVTDYTPYYPPRFGLQVEWYAANPNFHPIPPGYGLPWGTPEEEGIPPSLVFEAEMALAKAQLDTQTPPYERVAEPAKPLPGPRKEPSDQNDEAEPDWLPPEWEEGVIPMAYETPVGATTADSPSPGSRGFPPDWPDPRGFIPPSPRSRPPSPSPSNAPVIRHTRIYNGHDMQFTEALANYYYFRDEARFGGWKGYLQRSDDFIRFCCHMHLAETLTARGGAGETRVVWRWPTIR